MSTRISGKHVQTGGVLLESGRARVIDNSRELARKETAREFAALGNRKLAKHTATDGSGRTIFTFID